MFKVEEYKSLATANAKKKVTDLKVGDFVWVYGSHTKNDNGRLGAEIYYLSEKCYQCLGIIAGIEHKKDEEILTGDFSVKHEGGDRSDDVPEGANPYDERWRDTWFGELTLVITDKGRYLFANREGYDYVRYLYFWPGYANMFAQELAEEKEIREEWKRKEEEERVKRLEESRALLQEKFGWLEETTDFKKTIRAIMKRVFPDIKFSIRTRNYGWQGTDYVIHISEKNGSQEECRALGDVIREYFKEVVNDYRFRHYTGEHTDNGGAAYINLFKEKYGDYNRVSVDIY